MAYSPELTGLFPEPTELCAKITYEEKFKLIDDILHDPDHIHDSYELYVHLAGDVSFLVEDSLYPLKHGDVILTKPHEVHRCIYHKNGVHEHFCIWFKNFPTACKALQRELEKSTLIVLSDEQKEPFLSLCFAFYESFLQSELLQFRAAQSFFGILDAVCTAHAVPPAVRTLPAAFSDIISYIGAHYCEPSCTVSSICDAFYISKSTLCRHFRRHFQTTPSDYIESKRFSEAKKLLLSGQSVQSTCYSSGFSDCSYFIMRFHKKFGITPCKYQRTATKD